MDTICIPVPMPEDKAVQMEVTIDGETRLMQYRVETLHFTPGADADSRFDELRDFIQNYDEDWQLVQVGSPGPETVPVTFRRTGEK
jgi:hypothetical protein